MGRRDRRLGRVSLSLPIYIYVSYVDIYPLSLCLCMWASLRLCLFFSLCCCLSFVLSLSLCPSFSACQCFSLRVFLSVPASLPVSACQCFSLSLSLFLSSTPLSSLFCSNGLAVCGRTYKMMLCSSALRDGSTIRSWLVLLLLLFIYIIIIFIYIIIFFIFFLGG